MQSDNRFLDDLARLATGAMGALSGARSEVDQLVRQRMERLLADMDLVRRDEFEAVREMAVRAREENTRLAERLAVLEATLANGAAPPLSAPAPKVRARKAAQENLHLPPSADPKE
jgi:BMFP domain-containing protein YqiC